MKCRLDPTEGLLDLARRQAGGLPRGTRQRRAGYGPYWQDVRFEKYRLVVELDGRLGHDGVDRFRDMFRDNAGVVEGALTLRYGWFEWPNGRVRWRSRSVRC